MRSITEGADAGLRPPRESALQPATRRLSDGWLLLALAAFAVGIVPSLEAGAADAAALERMPARALRLSFAIQGLQALAIFLPSLLAALCLHASARAPRGRPYWPRAGYVALGLSAISGGALLIRQLAVGWCVVCLTGPSAAPSLTILRPEHALFGLGVVMTLLNAFLSVIHREGRAASLASVDPVDREVRFAEAG